MNTTRPTPIPQRQHGMALAVGMLILIVLSILGITALSMTTLQETMTGNLRDQELAFQSAETALRDAERQLGGMQVACSHSDVAPPTNGSVVVTGPEGQSVKVWSRAAVGIPDPWNDDSWDSATPYSGTLAGVAAQPRYTVEEISFDATDNTAVYRITARGVGGTMGARSVLQSYYRKSFDHVITITGTNGIDVVAIAENVLAAQLSVGNTIDVDVSLGGWQPESCPGTGDLTIYFDGNGGLDTFVLANLADVDLSLGSGGLQDITGSVSGLLYALTNFNIRRVLIENPDSTVVTIANTNLLTTLSDDNEYCINTGGAGDTGGTVLGRILGDFLTVLVGVPALGPILDLVDTLVGSLIGPSGLIPLLPASASIIADVAGNDRYEIYTDTTSSAFVMADVTGNDSYRVRGTGSGLVKAVVVADTAGTDTYDVKGGLFLKLDLNLGVLNTLTNLLKSPLINTLLNTLVSALNDLLNCQKGLLGWLVCGLLQPVIELLGDILDAVGNLFTGTPVDTGGTPSTFEEGLCAPEQGVRMSWREVRP